MSKDVAQQQTPEDRELKKKQSELAALEAELAQHELDLATLLAELRHFEERYLRIVGVKYAEPDEIEAQIAEAQACLNPRDQKAREQASEARAKAQDSAEAAETIQEEKPRNKFMPSENLKKLYREVAKCIHPDLATDEKERTRRQQLMTESNRAYEDGDEARLQAILDEWRSSPEAVKGDGPGVELVRVIRKIAQVEARLHSIAVEIAKSKESDLYQLKVETEKAEEFGQDLLAEMAVNVDKQITETRRRLDAIKTGKARR